MFKSVIALVDATSHDTWIQLFIVTDDSSGGLKRNGQNPDTMEAKTVKTKLKTQFGKKWVKSTISWHNFERL